MGVCKLPSPPPARLMCLKSNDVDLLLLGMPPLELGPSAMVNAGNTSNISELKTKDMGIPQRQEDREVRECKIAIVADKVLTQTQKKLAS